MAALPDCFPYQDPTLASPVETLLHRIEVIKAAFFSHWLAWDPSSPWANGQVEIQIEKLEHQVTEPHWKHPMELNVLSTNIHCIEKTVKVMKKKQLNPEKSLNFVCIMPMCFSLFSL